MRRTPLFLVLTSAAGTRLLRRPIPPSSCSTSSSTAEESTALSGSFWGDSDRLNDTNLKGSRVPLGYKSPFQRVRGAGATPPRPTSASSSAPQQSPAATHLYANKENAWENYTDDHYYGARRMKEYFQRTMKDRGVRYYILSILVMVAVAGSKLYQLEQEQRESGGLLGPKKKAYGSRLTVVLDVDETIVSFGDKAFRMKAGLIARPHLAELLDYLTEIDAEVVLWSACTDRYMRQVLHVVDPEGIRVTQYITKHKSWFSKDHYYEKNVLWLKRDLKDVLFIENRPLSIRNCNGNAILVDDFIRAEYMDTGRDHPPNDHALQTVKEILQDLETSGRPVPEYLADTVKRHKEIKEIPCHYAIRQLPEEIARGVFYFIGDKFRYTPSQQTEMANLKKKKDSGA